MSPWELLEWAFVVACTVGIGVAVIVAVVMTRNWITDMRRERRSP